MNSVLRGTVHLNRFEVILDVGLIRDSAVVYKLTGVVPYKVIRVIKIHDKVGTGQSQEISAKDGTVFLVSESGSISAYPDNTRVRVQLDRDGLSDLLIDSESHQ